MLFHLFRKGRLSATVRYGLGALGALAILAACQSPVSSVPKNWGEADAKTVINGSTKIEAESYSVMAGVQTEACSEGGLDVGWIDAGDWMVYPITINTTGSYTITYRVASPNSGKSLSADLNAGSIQLGSVAIPNTGNWQAWTTVSQTVTLNAGNYNFGINGGTGGFNVNWFNIAGGSSSSGKDNADNYTPGSGYSKVWSDEFNGTSLDTNVWSYDVGNGGWGNNEQEYYTSGSNVSFPSGENGNKYLAITAKQESMGGSNYTSARIKTQGKKTFTFSAGKTIKYVARIKVPTALTGGLWPAFWMLGNNIGSVGWPKCGEIDIMEAGANGSSPNTVMGTLHWGPDTANHYMYGLSRTIGENLGNNFHYFEATVSDSSITISIDGTQYFVMNNDVQLSGYYYFKHDFFFLLNLAVGGNFPYPVTASFPQSMLVDWVRVYSN